jgi:hypothetical protein
MQDHFIPTGMLELKKTDNKCWRGYGEIRALMHCGKFAKDCIHFGKHFDSSLKC